MNSLKKTFLGVVLLIAVLFSGKYYLEHPAGEATSGSNELNVFNWGDYIDPDLLEEFQEETGYKVIYETFDTNEGMLAKVQQGGTNYDLVFPSEYMVEQMISEGLLQPLDHSKIEGMDNFDPDLLDMAFDPGNKYSVPYFWGTVGILYNTKYVDASDIETWEDLSNPKFENEIILVDSPREIIGIGLAVNGYSISDGDPEHLEEALVTLKPLMKNVRALVNAEAKMYLAQEEANLCVIYSGEAFSAIAENPDLDYHVPEKGSNVWLDSIAIPKNAKNIEAAYTFINFLNRPDVAARNAEYIAYATPNLKAKELLPDEITSLKGLYPDRAVMENLEVYRNLEKENLILLNDLYLEFKLEPRS